MQVNPLIRFEPFVKLLACQYQFEQVKADLEFKTARGPAAIFVLSRENYDLRFPNVLAQLQAMQDGYAARFVIAFDCEEAQLIELGGLAANLNFSLFIAGVAKEVAELVVMALQYSGDPSQVFRAFRGSVDTELKELRAGILEELVTKPVADQLIQQEKSLADLAGMGIDELCKLRGISVIGAGRLVREMAGNGSK